MKTFKLDENGDVSITNNTIDMVNGVDLISQTLRQVLNTNLAEWFGDEEEGIDFDVILTKNPNADLIRDTIDTAVQKVADQLCANLETDNFDFSVSGRHMDINIDITLTSTGESTTVYLSF